MFLPRVVFASPSWESLIVAQANEEIDGYDPFSDYSEFEESGEEEADLHFFQNGRFFTLGFMMGYRMFTEELGNITEGGIPFGFFLSFFFDLRFAMQFSFVTGANNYNFTTPNGTLVEASSTVDQFGVTMKYYFNVQNVTKGLEAINPYLILGIDQISRTAATSNSLDIAKENSMGLDTGVGVEFPILNREMFLGAQATYHLINFDNEGEEIIVGVENTKIKPRGDAVSALIILGINF